MEANLYAGCGPEPGGCSMPRHTTLDCYEKYWQISYEGDGRWVMDFAEWLTVAEPIVVSVGLDGRSLAMLRYAADLDKPDHERRWVAPEHRHNRSAIGRRVRLIVCTDPHTRLKSGAEGTVTSVDDAGTVHVKWDDGSRLGLVADAGDGWEVL
jgi:hypothetical protein